MNPSGCFDPSLARYRVREVAEADVVDLLHLTHAHDTIERYRLAMARGERFPPVSVIRLFGRWVLADGHKRLRACRLLQAGTIPVEVWPAGAFAADQWGQAVRNGRKNARIVSALFVRPHESRELLLSTIRHWVRVARSLAALVRPRP